MDPLFHLCEAMVSVRAPAPPVCIFGWRLIALYSFALRMFTLNLRESLALPQHLRNRFIGCDVARVFH
jgi:hypothetical protein